MPNLNLTVLTGAGISAESGVKTFRDAGGLWEGFDIMDVASPIGWARNPELVRDFYNHRRAQLKEVVPNAAHKYFAEIEEKFNVKIITQNVDDLHERAGSSQILHLHGKLKSARCLQNPKHTMYWENDLNKTDLCSCGSELRPDIVWFGEAVPAIFEAEHIINDTDILVIVGTSLQVYPAAGLVNFLNEGKPVYYVDPFPIKIQSAHKTTIIPTKATEGIKTLREYLETII